MKYATTPYGEKMNEHAEAIEAVLGCPTVICYSAYETDENGLPINNMNELVITGKGILLAENDPFWGEGEDYVATVEDATWLDIAVKADEMVRVTGDSHHSFLESVYHIGTNENGIPVYGFSMGS